MDHPSPAEARDHADRQRFRWLDFLRGAEGRTGPAGTEHARLRAYVAQAGKILPPKGPIGAFVAQNPLQGLEDLPFDRAVREARRLLGGEGYLSNEAFRRIFATGRITRDDLVRALETQIPHLANRPPIEVRGRRVEARDVCLTHLLHEIRPLPHGSLRWQVSHGRATRRFRQDLPPDTRADLLHRASRDLQVGLARLGEEWTLADWFHAHTNLDLGDRIREQAGAALRTCAGSASRPFWEAFRASHATLTCRIGPTPGQHLDRCLNHLGIPNASREDYRKCVERRAVPLRETGGEATVTREEAAALWLHYERQLLRDLAPRHLGTQGTLPAIRRHFERDPEAYAVSSLWAAVLATLGLEDPLSVEDQEAGAAEALLHRVLTVARDGLLRRGQRADLVQRAHEALERDIKRIGPEWTVGDFCQHVTGARVTGAINDQMIRWCAAFLDEGLAGWPMPSRERGFYDAWRGLAERDPTLAFMGVKDFADTVRRLPSHPEDAVIQSLRTMGIPEEAWTGYLTLHLAALPGWAGMVKWRETHPLYEGQRRYPITLTQYLAVRLFYEVECVSTLCRKEWGIAGTLPALHSTFRAHPGEYFARSRIAAGGLPDNIAAGVIRTEDGAIALSWDAFTHPGYGDMRKAKGLSRDEQWFRFAEMLSVCSEGAGREDHDSRTVSHDGWRLFHLAQILGLSAEEIRGLARVEAKALLALLDDLSPEAHAPIWLQAYETHYRDRLLTLINGKEPQGQNGGRRGAQVIFCLDMREEGIRRHTEARSEAYETFGTAGFFHLPMMLRALASGVAKPSCPIPIDPRHTVVEGVRPGQGVRKARHEHRTKGKEVLHTLYHRLETNLATAYSLIDLLGVPFGITVMGRTLVPRRWRALLGTLRDRFVPSVRTSLRVDGPTEDEARAGLAARERDLILEAVLRHGRGKPPGDGLPPEAIEELRQVTLGNRPAEGQTRVARLLGLSVGQEAALIDGLRQDGLDPRHHAAQLAEIRMLGFAPEEQADLVEAQLRMIGLTDRIARLVVFCGHGSTTENNPYAAAYHCGACGGNRGGPNARAIAAMANSPTVRALLRRRGVFIPDDTHVLGAEHDTAADRFTYFDAEDLPPTHREEFERLARDLHQAGALHAQERCRRLPRAPRHPTPEQALRHVQTRSLDWAQVYPEWGHATCAAMVIGRRALTRGLFLDRRTYLQSYDPEQDPDGAILEEIMSAFIPVVRGITLDYYFSSIDSGINGVFGAGTKAIHNVVGLIGVMQGAGSDLRPGLPAQGVAPLHEPMRAQIVIESHPAKVASILGRYKVLENLFQNQWAHLIAWDPVTREFLRYRADGAWEAVAGIPPGGQPRRGIPAPSA